VNLEQADIKSLQQWMCNGELTSVELCQFYLERIETYDRRGPVLNSVIELNPDGLEQAEQFDLERSKKRLPRSPSRDSNFNQGQH